MRKRIDHIQASVLDRLIDHEPEVGQEAIFRRSVSVSQVKDAVIRDLEKLLNTKGYLWQLPEAYAATTDSVFAYGLRDFTAQNPNSQIVREQLRLEIENAIRRFEPRLHKATVISEVSEQRALRFRITALLIADPLTEPISFDTFFDVNSCECLIRR
jgi:type VI secretion system protein ImpF